MYIGVTNNLCRRLDEHKRKLARGFTAKYIETENPEWDYLSKDRSEG